jgi:superfamily I DNA/RNA helicase
VQKLKDAHRAGTPWRDMAIIYREYERDAKLIRKLLPAHGVPLIYFKEATYANDEDKVTLITMHSAKGLEFPLVVIPGADKIKSAGELLPQEAKLLYVAMTRATRELVLCGVEAAR